MKYLEFTFRTVPCTEIVNDVLSGVLGLSLIHIWYGPSWSFGWGGWYGGGWWGHHHHHHYHPGYYPGGGGLLVYAFPQWPPPQ